jgi:sugar phosphate isomerase/epimerase
MNAAKPDRSASLWDGTLPSGLPKSPSLSPRPSPLGRGRIVLRQTDDSVLSFGRRTRFDRLPREKALSLRERTRARGKRTSRREFFRTAAAGSLAALALPAAWPFGPTARAAEAPSWRMRLALSSVMFGELPIEQVCARAAALGFEGLDIWCPFGRCRHLDDVDKRLGGEGLKELLARHKLSLCSFSVYGVGFPRYAKLIGAFGGGVAVRESAYGKFKPEELTTRMRGFFEQLKPVIDQAGQVKARLAIENHGDALLSTLDSFKAFTDLNPAPAQVGLALAPYHLQTIKAPIEEAIALCGSQLLFFYAWQNAPDFKQLPGLGTTDFKPWLKALAKISYPGYVNPFMHGEPSADEMEKAVAQSRDYLKRCHREALAG